MTSAFAGIDVGGQSLKASLVDESSALLATDTVRTGPGTSAAELAESVSAVLRNFSAVAPIRGVGCGIAGCVSTAGVIRGCPNLPKLRDVRLADLLEESAGTPVAVDNDAHCHALAEGWTGAAVGVETFLLLALGSGIGSALVWKNRVFRGTTGFGCELGHMIIEADGRRCACGNKGCLEAYVSETAIRESVREASAEFRKRVDRTIEENADGYARTVFELADDGDGEATEIVRATIATLGVGLASAVNVLDVTTIVLSGGLAPGVVRRMAEVRRAMRTALFARDETAVAILPASAGRWSGAIGAARLAMESL